MKTNARVLPVLETLEDRQLLSTCHVTRLGDSGGGFGMRGDLRYCINTVNDLPGTDAIDFKVTGTINLTAVLPDLQSDMDIQGPGADLLTVRRDTGGDYRIFKIPAGATVQMTGVTIANGRAMHFGGLGDNGGGVWNAGSLSLQLAVVSGNSATSDIGGGVAGGGIYNTGNLKLVGTRVQDNAALSIPVGFSGHAVGGGIANTGTVIAIDSTISNNQAKVSLLGFEEGNAVGGGISNSGSLSLERCTVSTNVATSRWWDGFGGGISNSGAVVITNSTLSGNSVAGVFSADGGGIHSASSLASVVIRHSTITENTALGFWTASRGGGINWFGEMDLRNTIVADNSARVGRDLSGALSTSNYNLIGDSIGGSGYDNTDILNVDPLLGPLTDNGGPTLTHALLPGSPAIDAGDPNPVDPPEWDQRGPGFPRIMNGIIDIGAFEVQTTGAPLPRGARRGSPDPAVFITADIEDERIFMKEPINETTIRTVASGTA